RKSSGLPQAASCERLEGVEAHHADEHRRNEEERRGIAKPDRCNGRPGAIAYESPADAEQDGSPNETAVDPALGCRRKGRRAQRCGQTACETISDRCHRDRPDHDKRKAWVPVAEEIKKSEHLSRIDHLRHSQTQT